MRYFFLRIWRIFFIPEGGRKYAHTNSYNSAMTVIAQDDHLTAGAWAACGSSNNHAKVSRCTASWLIKNYNVTRLFIGLNSSFLAIGLNWEWSHSYICNELFIKWRHLVPTPFLGGGRVSLLANRSCHTWSHLFAFFPRFCNFDQWQRLASNFIINLTGKQKWIPFII